ASPARFGHAAPRNRGCRVGRRCGLAGASLFRRPPSERSMQLLPHSALQCLYLRVFLSRRRPAWDAVVTEVANGQGLSSACSHKLDPARLFSSPLALEVLESSNMVDLDFDV